VYTYHPSNGSKLKTGRYGRATLDKKPDPVSKMNAIKGLEMWLKW
jgi:hypothetical protein